MDIRANSTTENQTISNSDRIKIASGNIGAFGAALDDAKNNNLYFKEIAPTQIKENSPNKKTENNSETNKHLEAQYLVREGDNLESIISRHYDIDKQNYPNLFKALKTIVKEKNPNIDFNARLEKDSFIFLPGAKMVESDKRVVKPDSMSFSLLAARNLLLPLIPSLLNGDTTLLANIAGLVDPTSKKSLFRSLAGLATIKGGEYALGAQSEKNETITKKIIKQALDSKEANILSLGITTPQLEAKRGNKKKTISASLNAMGVLQSSLTISRPALASDFSEIRMAIIKLNIGGRIENTNAASLGKMARVKNLNTADELLSLSYIITTDNKRLEKILTGKTPAPNPFTLENMLPGDVITIDSSKDFFGTVEARGLAGKFAKINGLGASGQYVNLTGEGSRLVIQMSKAADNSRHVTIFSGVSQKEGSSKAGGAIYNPSLEDSWAKKYLGVGGFYARTLAQHEDISHHNKFNFVEINVDDKQGQKLFQDIVQTGLLPTARLGEKLDNILAHGQLIYIQTRESSQVKTTAYSAKSWSNSKNHIAGQELTYNHIFEPVSEFEALRQFKINHADAKSVLRAPLIITTNEAGEHKLGGIDYESGIVSKTLYRNDDNALVYKTKIDGETHKTQTMFLLSSLNVDKSDAIYALEAHEQARKTGKQPLIKRIQLETANGTFVGEQAIKYLKNKGGEAENDNVMVNIMADNNLDTKQFFRKLKSGLKKYTKAQNDDSWISSLANFPKNKIDSAEYFLNQYGFNYIDPDNPYFDKDIIEAKDTIELSRSLVNVDVGQLLAFMTQIGENFPVEVRLQVNY